MDPIRPSRRRRMEMWVALVLSGAAVVLLAFLVDAVSSSRWEEEDWLFRAVVAARQPFLSDLAVLLTSLGDPPVLVAVGLAVLLTGWPSGRWADRLGPLVALLMGSAANIWMKSWFLRARPGLDYSPLVEEPTFSFPSGHSMLSMCVYGFLSYLLMYSRIRRRWRALLFLCLWALIVGVGMSRVYLAAHYPGDVAGGYAVGFVVLTVCLSLHRWAVSETEAQGTMGTPEELASGQ